jgi:hypothetical protein
MKDAIIAEVWRNRDMLAARYGHNLDAIVAAMKKRQTHPLTKMVKKEKPNKRMQRILQCDR